MKYESMLIQNILLDNRYNVIELDSNGEIPTVWTVRKIEYKKEIYLIFLNKENIYYRNEYKDIILNKTMYNDTEVDIIYVVVVYKGEEYWRNIIADDYELITNVAVIDSKANDIVLNRLENIDVMNDLKLSMRRIDINNGKGKEIYKSSKSTMFLIFVNILVYFVLMFVNVKNGGNPLNMSPRILYIMGANVNINILLLNGQFYRWLFAMFLHGGILHISLNMLALYYVGPLVEKVYGKSKFLIIYFVSGICSSILSSMFLTTVSIGASGAIFGLLGAVLVFAFNMRKFIGKELLKNILFVIVINAVIGLTVSSIDKFGHLGGLIGGIFVSLLFIKKVKQEQIRI